MCFLGVPFPTFLWCLTAALNFLRHAHFFSLMDKFGKFTSLSLTFSQEV